MGKRYKPLGEFPVCSMCGAPAHLLVPTSRQRAGGSVEEAARSASLMCWRHFRGDEYRDPEVSTESAIPLWTPPLRNVKGSPNGLVPSRSAACR